MNGFMLIRHKVRNFTAWKQAYDAYAPQRSDAGLTETHLLRGTRAPNDVVLMFAAQDLNRAQAFADSADLRQTMHKAGVIDMPDICLLQR